MATEEAKAAGIEVDCEFAAWVFSNTMPRADERRAVLTTLIDAKFAGVFKERDALKKVLIRCREAIKLAKRQMKNTRPINIDRPSAAEAACFIALVAVEKLLETVEDK